MAREFKEYTADNNGSVSTVRACVETEETVGLVSIRGWQVQQTHPGDVLVETDRPDVYDVLSADQWASTGYGSSADSGDSDASSSATGSGSRASRASRTT